MSWISDFIKKKVDEGLQNISSGYGNWINGVVENVQSGIQQGIDYVKNSLGTSSGQDTTTPPATTPQTSTPTTLTTTPTQTTPTTTPETPSVTTQPATTPQTTAPTSTPQTTTPETPSVTTPPPTTPTTTAPETTTPVTTEPITTTPIEPVTGFDSYEDYVGNNMQNSENIYNNTVTTLDKQNGETLKQIDEALASGKKYAEDVKATTDAALEAQKNADIAYAETQRDLLKGTSQAEKDAVYKYAEEALAGALGYNQEAYGKLAEAITGQMEAGKLAASEAKNLLMIMAEEAKNTTYGAAERQRTEAERQADINRQRAITDANSAYEQNKAGYGANAEALANMGLSGGGYSDWINASAYAQQRSEVQGARAQSDAAKREAKYTEDMTKLQADQEYSNKKYQAESEYQNKLYDIDTSYRTNMSEAEQSKLAADKAAYDTEREAKRQADSKHNENVYNADSSYADWINKAETAEREGKLQSDIEYKGFLYDIETQADKNKLETNQKTELGKLEASSEYITAIMQNEGELAKYKEALKAGDEQAKQVQLSMYEKVLKGVSDGTYNAEVAAALADSFEFSQEWKDAIANAATTREESVAFEKAEEKRQQKISAFGDLLGRIKTGELTKDEVMQIASDFGFDPEKDSTQLNLLGAAADRFAAGTKEAKTEAKNMTFLAILDGANTGAYKSSEIETIAGILGLDPNNEDDAKLIGMAQTAAKAFEDGKASELLKSDTEYKNALYTEIMTLANNGSFNEDQIRDIASKYGFEGQDLENLAKAAKDYAANKAIEEANLEKGMSVDNKFDIIDKGLVTSDTTNEDIDNYVKDELLTEDDAAEIEEYRDELIRGELETYAKNGYTTEAVDRVEELVENGIISRDDDVYQKTYFDVGLYNAQNLSTASDIKAYESTLAEQKAAGKLSEADYNSLMDYVYKTAGKVVDKSLYTFKRSNSAESSGPFEYLDVSINGKDYKGVWLYSEKKADKTLSNVLDKIAADGEMLVMFNNELYAKTYIYGWCPVNNEDLKKDYLVVAESKPEVSKPNHTV